MGTVAYLLFEHASLDRQITQTRHETRGLLIAARCYDDGIAQRAGQMTDFGKIRPPERVDIELPWWWLLSRHYRLVHEHRHITNHMRGSTMALVQMPTAEKKNRKIECDVYRHPETRDGLWIVRDIWRNGWHEVPSSSIVETTDSRSYGGYNP